MQNESNIHRETDHPEELLDLVNENDEVIGIVTRAEVYAKNLHNYRVVHAFIRNGEGRIWIPRRVKTKKLYPDALDYSIAGHVESGESYAEALKKEALEEARIDLNQTPYTALALLTPHEHNVHCFQMVYEIRSDEAPEYNREDFSGYEWLTPAEIVARHEAGEVMKSDIVTTLKYFYQL